MKVERKLISDYQTDTYALDYPFPEVDSWDKSKAKEYIEAIWARFVNNACYTSPAIWDEWSMNRLYGEGRQPESIYYAWLKGSKKYPSEMDSIVSQYDDNGKAYKRKLRKGWNSVDFTVHSFIPKIKASIKGLLADVDYLVKANAIDPFSRDEEENSKWKSLVYAKEQEFILKLHSKFNIPTEDMSFIPESMEEMELYAANEGFKVNWAILMDKLLRFTYDISGYAEEKEMWINDVLDNGFICSTDEVNVDTGLIEHHYVDPASFIVQTSQYSDFRDSQYAGHVSLEPFSAVKKQIPEEEWGELETAAQYYLGLYGNPQPNGGRADVVDSNNRWIAGLNKCLVFNCSWIALDYEYYKEIKNYGEVRRKRVPAGTEPGSNREKIVRYPKRKLFHAKWVVGTNIVYGYGQVYNQPKSKYGRDVRLNYHMYSLPYKALTPTLRPLEDEFQKSWLMYQNGIATARGDGYQLNIQMLQNVPLNGQPAKPTDIIEFYNETNVMPYFYSMTGQYKGGAAVPLTPIQSPIPSIVESNIRRMQFVYQQVQEVTGINPLSMGSSPTSATQVGTAEMGYQATLNVLKPIITSCFKVKESIGRNVVYRIQNAVTFDERFKTAYSGILSETEIALLQDAEKNGCMYSIAMKAKPRRDQINNMLQTVQESYRAGLLAPDDYLFVMEQLLDEYDLSKIRQYVSYKIKKTQERQQQERLQAINQQNQGLAAIEQQKAGEEMQKIVESAEGKIKQIMVQNQGMLDKQKLINEGEIEKIVRKIIAENGR